MDKVEAVEAMARALCRSRKFETGQGGCAAICMSVLGSSRGGPHGCPHSASVHNQLATAALTAAEPFFADGRGWLPIADAPKDGTRILVVLGPNDSDHIGHLAGRVFDVRHEGTTPSGFNLGWSLYPGYGGVPDQWFAGWRPLPDPPVLDEVEGG